MIKSGYNMNESVWNSSKVDKVVADSQSSDNPLNKIPAKYMKDVVNYCNANDKAYKSRFSNKNEYELCLVDDAYNEVVNESMNESKSSKIKVTDLDQYKYGVNYTCNNPTFGDDFLLRANEIGAIKVITTQLNPKTNRPFSGKSIFYAIKNKSDYDKLKSIAKELGDIVKINGMYEINWDMHIVVSVDDYDLGSYTVKKGKR